MRTRRKVSAPRASRRGDLPEGLPFRGELPAEGRTHRSAGSEVWLRIGASSVFRGAAPSWGGAPGFRHNDSGNRLAASVLKRSVRRGTVRALRMAEAAPESDPRITGFQPATNAGARHVKTKMWVLGAADAAALAAGCAGSQKARGEAKAEDEAAAEKQVAGPAPEYGTFGVDLEGMDTTQAAGNDWFAYVNGNWTKNTEIPADKARYSMFNVLTDRAQEQNRAIIEEAAASNAAEGEV